jgi:hypothetical protein
MIIWPLDYRYTQFLNTPVWQPTHFGMEAPQCRVCNNHPTAVVIILSTNHTSYTYVCPFHLIKHPWQK